MSHSMASTEDALVVKSAKDSFNSDSIPIAPNSSTIDLFKDIKDFIASWAVQFKVKHNALDGLLSGLQKHKCFQSIPLSARTLLCTPRQLSRNIKTIKPVIYYHFGLASGIHKYTPQNLSEIKIAIGIDGLPLTVVPFSPYFKYRSLFLTKSL